MSIICRSRRLSASPLSSAIVIASPLPALERNDRMGRDPHAKFLTSCTARVKRGCQFFGTIPMEKIARRSKKLEIIDRPGRH
jgi:hypothetical protein